jgi:heparin/heparan-sulfate lyase
MGVVFMRSGWGDAATFAALVAGGDIRQHRHYDQGHFVIYRKGFLAIDSGDYGPREANEHLTEYCYRTVAHNAVLIHAPPEADTRPKVWGGTPETYDGGQFQQEGRQVAFETNALYSYAATDATACYDPRKCKEAVRQFVFVHPDTFVVCDRVTAARADQRKAWLLHTVNEPRIMVDGRTFRAEHREGALICRTVLPSDARLVKIGGPGKEYWSAGKNRAQVGKHKLLAGAWRIEASPGEARAGDVFVHLVRVGDRTMKDLGAVERVRKGARAGVRFSTAAGHAEVTFNLDGEVGGHITLTGPRPLDRDLANQVNPQTGLATPGRR